MALLFIDSFDHYGTETADAKGWTLTGSTITIPSSGRNSTNSMRFAKTSTGLNAAVLGVTTSGTTCVFGVAFQEVTAGGATYPLVSIMDGTNPHITISVTATRTLQIRRGSQTDTLLETSVSTLSTTTWHFIEVKVSIADAGGTWDVLVDGVSFLSGTGDTRNGGNLSWSGLRFGHYYNYSINAHTYEIDDLYVCDGTGGAFDDFQGDHRIVCVLPDGAGNSSDWSPTSGANYTNVDDNPPDGATSVVTSNTVGDHDTYTFAALGVTGDVAAVQANYYAKGDQAGVRDLSHVTRISTTDYTDANAVTLGSDWEFARVLMTESPATASAWTVTEIDAAEFGPKVDA